jgi:hypothetical protein
MAILRFPNAGAAGVVKDLSVHDLPPNVWTDSSNVRFRNGFAQQFLGHGAAYGTPAVVPQHVMALNVVNQRYWLYASAQKIYAVTVSGGAAVHTNLTRQTAGNDVNYTGVANQWTSTLLSGIPIFNAGNEIDPPQRWNLNIGNRMTTLDNWPANTYCKSLRTFKSFLVALNVTKGSQNYPYMVKWSTPAEPGTVPTTWDPADATQDAGEQDLAESNGRIVDGLQLRDYFMIYKEDSVWRMSYIGGAQVMGFQKVLGVSGALNRNCIVEIDGFHFVLTASDVVVHDGQTATSILDGQAREALFQAIDAQAIDKAFVFKNPFLNEVFVCYPSIGSTTCDTALVWNYREKTVTYRTLPNLNHANYGTVDASLSDSWDADGDPWNADLTLWNGPGFTPNTTRVLMASNDNFLYLLDATASFAGMMPMSYLERRGLGYGQDESIKLVKAIRPRIMGNDGETVKLLIGSQDDPYEDPDYTEMTYTIGEDLKCDCFVSGRYIAVRVESGTAYQWRLDSFDLEIEEAGMY